MTSLGLIVVHHRTPELLQACLERVARFAPGADVLVVDTGPEGAAPVGRFGDVRLVHTSNHSLAHAVNVGLKSWLETSSRPFAAHLNADVMIGADTLPALQSVLERENVGVVGPRVVTPEGAWQNQGLPYRRHYRRLARVSGPAGSAPSVSVPWLSGCLQMTRRDVVERVGGMNSTLRFYNEDMEWCWRMRAAGFECRLVGTTALHIGGASTPAATPFLVEGYRGGYRLSEMYKPPLYRALHRAVVRAEAGWKAGFSKDARQRDAYKGVLKLFGGEWSSPFGETLEDAARPRDGSSWRAPQKSLQTDQKDF